MRAHPGFKAVQEGISKREGIPMKNAGAILASKSRKASKSARKRNPRLNKVKGVQRMQHLRLDNLMD